MAFERPTLAELVARVQGDLVTSLEGTGAVLRRSVVHVLARVVAGAAHMLHGHLSYLARQIVPDQADEEFLLRWAGLFGIRRSAATFAGGMVEVSGTDGAMVPEGAVLLRSDGARFLAQADVELAGGGSTVEVQAEEAGAAANSEPGVALVFETPLPGVVAEAFVASSWISGGADEESIDSVRARLLERLRNPPHGGRAADYVAWAREVPGVTRAWVYPRELGEGTVTVRFVRDADENPIPDAAAVAAVQAHIDEMRPVTADVHVLAPIAAPVPLTISITPSTASTRAAVRAELEDLVARLAEPGGKVLLSQLRQAVGQAEGVTDYRLFSPTADRTFDVGTMPVVGTITWL